VSESSNTWEEARKEEIEEELKSEGAPEEWAEYGAEELSESESDD